MNTPEENLANLRRALSYCSSRSDAKLVFMILTRVTQLEKVCEIRARLSTPLPPPKFEARA